MQSLVVVFVTLLVNIHAGIATYSCHCINLLSFFIFAVAGVRTLAVTGLIFVLETSASCTHVMCASTYDAMFNFKFTNRPQGCTVTPNGIEDPTTPARDNQIIEIR